MKILEVENISKSFEISQIKAKKFNFWLSQIFTNLWNRKKETLDALKDISFELKQGEFVGLIGQNGSGKSTLLKIFAQITPPTAGEIRIYGRVVSLIEVGTGFNKELTGRENIFLNGAILGMSQHAIIDKLDSIIAFAGINPRLIDTPIKKYSSGMKIRLGFAVAVHLEADLLLMDEVLAVSDIAFQQKGLQKLQELVNQGKSVIFVSHDLNIIQQICPRTIVLDDGKIGFDGATTKAVQFYKNRLKLNIKFSARQEKNVFEDAVIKIYSLLVQSLESGVQIFNGDSIKIDLNYELLDKKLLSKNKLKLRLIIHQNTNNLRVFSVKTEIPLEQKKHVTCTIPNVPLISGKYSIELEYRIHQNWKKLSNAAPFEVLSRKNFFSDNQDIIKVDAIWDF